MNRALLADVEEVLAEQAAAERAQQPDRASDAEDGETAAFYRGLETLKKDSLRAQAETVAFVFHELGRAVRTGNRRLFLDTLEACAGQLHIAGSALLVLHAYQLLEARGPLRDGDLTFEVLTAMPVEQLEDLVVRAWARLPAPSVLRRN